MCVCVCVIYIFQWETLCDNSFSCYSVFDSFLTYLKLQQKKKKKMFSKKLFLKNN